MGRKPNPQVARWFERGQKLSDSSNRYPHTCRMCGERFPKGRNDTLIHHITKRCPSISVEDRFDACMQALGPSASGTGGMNDDVRILAVIPRLGSKDSPQSAQFYNHQHQQHQQQPVHHQHQAGHGSDLHNPIIIGDQAPHEAVRQHDAEQAGAIADPHGWSALEALAEASRQVNLSEKHDHAGHADDEHAHLSGEPHMDLDDGLRHLDDPHIGGPHGMSRLHAADKTVDTSFSEYLHNMSDEVMPPATSGSDTTALDAQAVAAAASRLSPSLLGGPLPDSPSQLDSVPEPSVALPAQPAQPTQLHLPLPILDENSAPRVDRGLPKPRHPGQDTWGPVAYKPLLPSGRTALPHPPSKGGHRIDVSSGASLGRVKHLRAKFTPDRRKEVQEVRKLGACMRCKLLRKTCDKETPCSACFRVLSPRVWTTGCVRTKLSEQLELWSAGLHTVLVNRQIAHWKECCNNDLRPGPTVAISLNFGDVTLANPGQASIQIETLVGPDAGLDKPEGENNPPGPAMLNHESQDMGECVRSYMQQVFSDLVAHEPQDFTKKMLQVAQHVLAETEDELLTKALELWGLTELADREMSWNIEVQPTDTTADTNPALRYIRRNSEATEAGPYGLFSMQLSAAAERRANATSKELLLAMQRVLLDSKVKIGFPAYLACLVFVVAIEKELWIFKAWEVPHLKKTWPLSQPPEIFTAQVMAFPAVLRMILAARRVLPRVCRDSAGKLAAVDGSEAQIMEFFDFLSLDFDHVVARHNRLEMDNSNSRSLELHLASNLLLPDAAQ